MDGERMRPGEQALAAWSGVELLEPLPATRCSWPGGGGRRLVVRRSGRPAASLEWELDLLKHLREGSVLVPEVVPADDGRRQVDGLLVQRFLPGRPPRDDGDWRRVVEALRAVHQLTVRWPQRPEFASAWELLAGDRGGDVCLDAMPADAVRAVRAAWRPILDGPECAIHADIGGGNVLVDGQAVALLDWDEARVDVPWFDFAHLPEEVEVPSPTDQARLVTAGVAWEAATCWVVEPAYEARRLAELPIRT
jgi:Ser/Thr protein kinase RdoA (MazF antagonist)